MNRHWSDTLKRLAPYTPGEQAQGPDIIKLNTNERGSKPSDLTLLSSTPMSMPWRLRKKPPRLDER